MNFISKINTQVVVALLLGVCQVASAKSNEERGRDFGRKIDQVEENATSHMKRTLELYSLVSPFIFNDLMKKTDEKTG